jgi:Na+/proline symporter
LLFCGVLNVVFAAHSGLWGVLVIDMVQFFIKMTAVISAAYFALEHVGGMNVLLANLSQAQLAPDGKHVINYLNFFPDFANNWDMAVAIFIMPLAVQWWAVWYPGSEPGGGSYVAQRMLASKSEKDSLGAVLFFNVVHYVVRPWPWILVGLCSLIVYPTLADIQKAFPNLDPALLGHDIAYPAMLKFLPPGFVGLMVGGLIAANSSTILTHLNWGASYLVHDFYQRFVKKDASEKHYVWVARLTTVLLFLCSALMTFCLESSKHVFDILLQIGAGTGLLYLVRWFWWRINAWCELVAMLSSFVISVVLLILQKNGVEIGTHVSLFITVIITTISWLIAAYLAPQTEQTKLVEFYQKVKPFGPGWKKVRLESGICEDSSHSTHESFPLALLGWVCGCSLIWSLLFLIGNLLYHRWNLAIMLSAISAICSLVLLMVIRKLWADPSAES